MSVLIFLAVGMLVGWLTSVLVVDNGLDEVGDIVVATVGALAGGLTYNALELAPYGVWGSAVMAALGSIVLLILATFLFGSPRVH